MHSRFRQALVKERATYCTKRLNEMYRMKNPRNGAPSFHAGYVYMGATVPAYVGAQRDLSRLIPPVSSIHSILVFKIADLLKAETTQR